MKFWVIMSFSRRRQWHPTPVLLLGKSHGWRSLVGCSPWGHEESDTTEQLHFHFSLSCLEKEMATHSSVLAWRIPGTGEPVGLPSVGSHRVRHDWSNLAAAAAAAKYEAPMSSSVFSLFKGVVQLAFHLCYRLKTLLMNALWYCPSGSRKEKVPLWRESIVLSFLLQLVQSMAGRKTYFKHSVCSGENEFQKI